MLNIDKYIKYGEKIKLITYNESISNIYKFIFFKKGLRDKIFEAKLRITLNWYKKNL